MMAPDTSPKININKIHTLGGGRHGPQVQIIWHRQINIVNWPNSVNHRGTIYVSLLGTFSFSFSRIL